MLKFTGNFSILSSIKFVCNHDHSYYYLPNKRCNRYYNPISIDIKTRKIEYVDEKDLDLIKNWIEKIV